MEEITKSLRKQLKRVLKFQRGDYRRSLEEVNDSDMDVNEVFLSISPSHYNQLVDLIMPDCRKEFIENLSFKNAHTFFEYLSNENLARILNDMPVSIKFCSDERFIKLLKYLSNYNLVGLLENILDEVDDLELVAKFFRGVRSINDEDLLRDNDVIDLMYSDCLNKIATGEKEHKEALYNEMLQWPSDVIAQFIERDFKEALDEFIFSYLDPEKIMHVIINIDEKLLSVVLMKYKVKIITEFTSKKLINFIFYKFKKSDLLSMFAILKEKEMPLENFFEAEHIYEFYSISEDSARKEILVEILPNYGTDAYKKLYGYLSEQERLQMLQLMASEDSLKSILEKILDNISSKRELDLTETLILKHLKCFKENKECSTKA